MDEPAIQTKGLVKRYETLSAVDGLDLTVGRGEVFGLIGPDGAGKTTTMRMLAGVLKPDDGLARVLGSDVISDPERVKEKIGYMSQRFGLYEDLTVSENIDFYADLYLVGKKEREVRFKRLMEFSRLSPFLGSARRQALRRHEAEAGARVRPDPHPRAAAPGRADQRRRPGIAAGILEDHL